MNTAVHKVCLARFVQSDAWLAKKPLKGRRRCSTPSWNCVICCRGPRLPPWRCCLSPPPRRMRRRRRPRRLPRPPASAPPSDDAGGIEEITVTRAEEVREPAEGADRDHRVHLRSARAEGHHRRRLARQIRARRRHRRHLAVLRLDPGAVGLHPRHRPERLRLQPRPRRWCLCRWRLLRAHSRCGRRPARPRPYRAPEGAAGHAVRSQYDRRRDQRRHARSWQQARRPGRGHLRTVQPRRRPRRGRHPPD